MGEEGGLTACCQSDRRVKVQKRLQKVKKVTEKKRPTHDNIGRTLA